MIKSQQKILEVNMEDSEIIRLGTHQTTILMWALKDYADSPTLKHRETAEELMKLFRQCAKDEVAIIPAVTRF